MKSYVLVYATQVPSRGPAAPLLIERRKQDWQFGRLNLPGGSIEPGENPVQAAIRELREETSIVASTADCQEIGKLIGNGWEVFVVCCPYHETFGGQKQVATSACPEEGIIHKMFLREALASPQLIPNLQAILPLAESRICGWSMAGHGSEGEWLLKLKVPDVVSTQA